MRSNKQIIIELREALKIADKLKSGDREMLFARLVSEYVTNEQSKNEKVGVN